MKKRLLLVGIVFVLLAACGIKESTATPIDVPALQTSAVQTVFAGTTQTATANVPTNTPSPEPTPTFALTVNGQLQGKLAFIRNYNLWVSINGVETQLTTDAISTKLGSAELWYSNPKISPNGTQIAYRKQTYDLSTHEGTSVLVVSDIDGKNVRQLVNDVRALEWSSDSQQIYYLVSNGYDVTTGLETIVVKSVAPTTSNVVEHGQFAFMSGCGGGGSDRADHVSGSEEIGYLGKGHIFTLSPQNNYVMHSTSCSNGLGALNLSTKQDIILDDGNVYAATISTDGTRIAAASENNIMIFNLASGVIEQTFPISEPPRALIWDNTSTVIFYSTSKSVGTQDLDEAIGLEVFNSRNNTITLKLSTLWKLSLDNGESVKISDMEVHDLKPIFALDQKVLVCAIENTNVLFDYLAQGNRENIEEHFPNVNLVEIDLATLTSNVIVQKTMQADFLLAR